MKQYIEQNKERFFDELFSLLRIPSVSAKAEHKPDMQRCAERLVELLLEAGAAPGREQALKNAIANAEARMARKLN